MSLKPLFFCLPDMNEPISRNLWREALNCNSEVLRYYESTQRLAWPNHEGVEPLEDEGSSTDSIPQTAWKKSQCFEMFSLCQAWWSQIYFLFDETGTFLDSLPPPLCALSKTTHWAAKQHMDTETKGKGGTAAKQCSSLSGTLIQLMVFTQNKN